MRAASCFDAPRVSRKMCIAASAGTICVLVGAYCYKRNAGVAKKPGEDQGVSPTNQNALLTDNAGRAVDNLPSGHDGADANKARYFDGEKFVPISSFPEVGRRESVCEQVASPNDHLREVCKIGEVGVAVLGGSATTRYLHHLLYCPNKSCEFVDLSDVTTTPEEWLKRFAGADFATKEKFFLELLEIIKQFPRISG